METYTIHQDITVICLRAASFPEGVTGAHEQLLELLGSTSPRRVFGISRPEGNQDIVYRAAAEEAHPGEAAELGCEAFTIRKGAYTSILLKDYHLDLQGISRAFEKLLADPLIDPQGYCLEQYEGSDDVRCMVGLKHEYP